MCVGRGLINFVDNHAQFSPSHPVPDHPSPFEDGFGMRQVQYSIKYFWKCVTVGKRSRKNKDELVNKKKSAMVRIIQCSFLTKMYKTIYKTSNKDKHKYKQMR